MKGVNQSIRKRRGRPRKLSTKNKIITEFVDLDDLQVFARQACIEIPGISREERAALAKGLAELVGHQRVINERQRVWERKGRGNKHKFHHAVAILDCGRLWTKVTGKDWRTARRSYGQGWLSTEERLNQRPEIILTRELLRLANGEPYDVWSLDRALRQAKKIEINP